jgi:hypothetical protein
MNSQSQLIEKLIVLEEELFTGLVTVITPDDKQWNIYLYRGMLLWAEGGSHVYRFWQRHLNLLCPQGNIVLFDRERVRSNSNTDYYLITTLLKQKLATREQIASLIETRLNNIFFDIFQSEHEQTLLITNKSQSAHSLLKNNFNLTLSLLAVHLLLSKAYHKWSIWKGKGLASCSPNLAPLLKKDSNLNRQVSPLIFQNMQRMLDGKNTLRDLATQMDKDVFDVACALVPYFFKGYIRLVEIPDLPGIDLPFIR